MLAPKHRRVRWLALATSLLAACGGAEEPNPTGARLVLGAECPAGTSWDGSRCAPAKNQMAAAPAQDPGGREPDRGEPAPAQVAVEPPAAEVSMPPHWLSRDPRRGVHKPRPARLLKTEIHQLKMLFEATPREAPDRRPILRRLADDSAELAWAAPSESEKARAQAIHYYVMLTEENKSNCPSTEMQKCRADEALYFLALELELIGKINDARKSYFELIRSFPQSDYIPYAYFAFGELYFKEGMEGDRSKLPMAKKLYDKILQFARSPITVETTLRLADIAEAEGDKATAEQHRKHAATMRRAPVEPNPAPR